MAQRIKMNSSEFQPKNEYLLVKPEDLEKEEKSSSGIVLSTGPKSSLIRPTLGTVISVGSDIEDIKEQATVVWPETDGLDLEFNDGNYILIRYRSIVGSKKL